LVSKMPTKEGTIANSSQVCDVMQRYHECTQLESTEK
jgi:hypothetical protein